MTTLNDALLERTMAHIEANPDSYAGGFWREGSRMDFAGHAAIQAGAEWVSTVDDTRPTLVMSCGDLATNFVFRSSVVRTPGGQLMHVADFAAQELGITDHVEDALFSSATVEQLREMVNHLVEFGTFVDPTPVTQEEVTAP